MLNFQDNFLIDHQPLAFTGLKIKKRRTVSFSKNFHGRLEDKLLFFFFFFSLSFFLLLAGKLMSEMS